MPPRVGERTWLRVTVICPPEATDAVSVALLRLSPNGVTTDENGGVRISGYLGPYGDAPDPVAAEASVREALAAIPEELLPRPPHVETAFVPERDWIDVFRAQHRPVRVGHIVVKPTWEPWPGPHLAARSDAVLVELAPGRAVGPGLHPTTRACLLELQDRIKRGDRIIDFGAGSGVLGIAAAKLGAAAVLAIDCDPTAVEVARDNARLNGVDDRMTVRVGDGLADVGPGWALILANISPPVVAREAPAALRALRPGGAYVCAGIPVSREHEVLEALREVGFAGILPRMKGDWVGFVCVAARDGGDRR